MTSFSDLIQQGTAQAWLFIPSAILLGALHGLEPGHSKTMMAAFIVAIRGSVKQAFLLGIAATISHTLVVWVIAIGGMYLWQGVDAETFEPYFQLASAVLIIGIALWMIRVTWLEQQRAKAAANHDHAHEHAEDIRRIDTGHGRLAVEVFETGVPPRWRIRVEQGPAWDASDVTVLTRRPDGAEQMFRFQDRGGYLESVEEIPEPHAFTAWVVLLHGDHAHEYELAFEEGHSHDAAHAELAGLDVSDGSYQDAHERAHANAIKREFANRNVTNWQIVIFGLTGGLIPCPAAITVLLLCLQLKQMVLGFALVLCFSIGLAITLVLVGVAAALSVRHVSARFSWFNTVARRAPYVSSALIILVGLYVGYIGISGLLAGHTPQAAALLSITQS